MKKILAIVVFSFFTHCPSDAQWVKTTFPHVPVDLLTYSFAYAKGNSLFIALDGSGYLYRSTDNGDTWKNIYDAVPPKLRVPGAISYCGDHLVADFYDNFHLDTARGVFVSSDNGDSWQLAQGSGDTFFDATQFANFGSYLFATCGSNCLERSSDCGYTWQDVTHGIQGSGITCMTQGNGYIYGVSFGQGVFRSSNFGDSAWAISKKQPTFAGRDIATIGKSVFVSDGYLWRSDDSAEHWHPLAPDTSLTKLIVRGKCLIALGHDVRDTYKDMILCSSDLGLTWKDLTEDLPAAFRLFAGGTYLFAQNGSGIWRRPLSDFTNAVISKSSDTQNLLVTVSPEANSITAKYYTDAFTQNPKLEIYDILGRLICSHSESHAEKGWNTMTYQLNQIPSGTYIHAVEEFSDNEVNLIRG
jgi:hypothetical protein